MYNKNEKFINVIILAAGNGKRMYSKLPKTLHTLAGKPLIKYILETLKSLNNFVKKIYIVYGYGKEKLQKSLQNEKYIEWIYQTQPLGTGDAVKQVLLQFHKNEDILILYGDVPLISKETILKLYKKKPKNGISLLSAKIEDPTGYGRIIRNKQGKITGIIEHIEANKKELQIKEINTGVLIINSLNLKKLINKVNDNNYQKEFYITDIINIAYKNNIIINSIYPKTLIEIQGINNHLQLSQLEKSYQKKQIKNLLINGLKIFSPDRFNLRGSLQYGIDVIIEEDVLIKGYVTLGDRVIISKGCILKNSIIGKDCQILPYSIIENTILEEKCIVGPFAYLRQENKIGKKTQIGNFIDMKKSIIGKKTKIKHLSFIGNAKIGNFVNIGAGTIICNYDGNKKWETIIGDNVFIGSDSQLIAPLYIVKNSTIAAGTTIMKNIKNPGLIFNKKEQINKLNWKKK